MWYAVVDAASIGLSLTPHNGKQICKLGECIKVATREQYPVQHPHLHYPGCDILVFRDKPSHPRAHAKNAVVMSNGALDWNKPETWTGMIDRSPCGTGTCAVMAVLHARDQLALQQDFVHESIVGTLFTGRLVAHTDVPIEPHTTNDDGSSGNRLNNITHHGTNPKTIPGLVATITGQAWITQISRVLLDPTDPFPTGYTVADIWA
eukprot:c9029_g1_i2.p1 GENE.c9029_g1_i2~~c9029_g1_i2.p1  ORF type:complete len:206 (+),score=49.55 c9029_g1_i2:394-1011(+)